MSLIRTDALRGYSELVSECGGDAGALLAKARLSPAALDDPESFVPYANVIRLLELSARALDCPDFGLQLSRRQDIGILGPLAIAMQNSDTVGDALVCATRFIHFQSPAQAWTLAPGRRNGRVLAAFEILLDHVPQAHQAIELSLGVATRVFSLLTDDRRQVTGVYLPHSAVAPRERYRAHLGPRIQFDAGIAAFEVREADLGLAIPSGRRELRKLAEDYLEVQYDSRRTALAAQVREVVRRSLGTGRSSCVDVASNLALHPRTLQRRLRAEGASFETIRDEARADLARRYLREKTLPLSRVAGLLDYSEQSALTRSCYRWFGAPPRDLRARLDSSATDLSG